MRVVSPLTQKNQQNRRSHNKRIVGTKQDSKEKFTGRQRDHTSLPDYNFVRTILPRVQCSDVTVVLIAMSAFAVSYAGGGRSEVDTVSLQEKTDQVERNATFWQRIQHKYSCCLVDFIVHFLCPTRESHFLFPFLFDFVLLLLETIVHKCYNASL